MLHLCISSRPVSIPLINAQYQLMTDAVGDTEATITLLPPDASMLLGTNVGQEIVVWCTRLHRMIWRGQIEAMNTAPDGTTELRCLGLWRLIGDLPITTVLNDSSTAHWEVAPRQWITGTAVYPNPDRWEISKNQYLIATAREGEEYDTDHQVMFVYRFPEPQRYVRLSEQALSYYVWLSGIVTEVQIGYLSGLTPPYTPMPLQTIFATGGGSVGLPTNASNVAGWYMQTTFPYAVETATGNSRLRAKVTVNNKALPQTVWSNMQSYVSAQIGMTIICNGTNSVLFQTLSPTRHIRAPIADLIHRPMFTAWKYDPRIQRDTRTIQMYEQGSRTRYRIVHAPTMTRDYSAVPTHVYASWQDESSQLHATSVAEIDTVAALKLYNRMLAADLVQASQSDAQFYRDQLVATYRQLRPALSLTVPHAPLQLATAAGAHVPSWAAEPGDELLIDAAWMVARIVKRVIGESDVTYDVTIPDDRLSRLAQR